MKLRNALQWIKEHREYQDRKVREFVALQQRRLREQGHTSGMHDSGGLADIDDYRAAGLLNGGAYIGFDELHDCMLFHPRHFSKVTVGKPGIGKGSDVIQPNLGWIDNDTSLVVIDIGHENYRVSADFRASWLGQNVVANNPSGAYGIESVGICPLAHITSSAARGDMVTACRYISNITHTFVPQSNARGENDTPWVAEGARDYAEPVLKYGAAYAPEIMNMRSMRSFLSQPVSDMIGTMVNNISQSEIGLAIMEDLLLMQDELNSGASKQAYWKMEKLRKAFTPYAPGTLLGADAAKSPFDVSRLKKEPTTLYLQCPEVDLEANSADLARKMTAIVDQLADVDGPQKVLFVFDEVAQFPKTALPTWVRQYRKRGLAFWLFSQTEQSLVDRYGKEGTKDLFESADMVQHLSVDSLETAKRLSARAGKITRYGQHYNEGADNRTASASGGEQAVDRLPVADILNMPRDAQLIEISGCKLIKASRCPWWELSIFQDRLRHFDDMNGDERWST